MGQEAWPTGAIDLTSKGPAPQSVLSFSEESLTSGEDLVLAGAAATATVLQGCREYEQ